jgi:hypothetical protein
MRTAIEIQPERPFEDGVAAGKAEGKENVLAQTQALLGNRYLKRSLGAMSRGALGRFVLSRLEAPPDYGLYPELEDLYPERVDFIRGFASGAACTLTDAAVLSYLRSRDFAARYYFPLHELENGEPVPAPGCTGVLLIGRDGILASHGLDDTPPVPRPRGYRHRTPPPFGRWRVTKTACPRALALKRPRTGYIEGWGVTNEKGLGAFCGTSCGTWLDEPIEDAWPVGNVPLLRFAANVKQLVDLYRRYTLHNWGRGSQLWADTTGDAVIVEKSFRRVGFRRLEGSTLWCTEGHFESPDMHAYLRAKRLEYVKRSGKHLGAVDLQYADDCAVRFRHIGELCHEPLGRGYRHMTRIMTDHAVFPRAVCRHGGPDTDGYDKTVTQICTFADVTHNRRFERAWIPWKKFPCQRPWTVTQYPARPGEKRRACGRN